MLAASPTSRVRSISVAGRARAGFTIVELLVVAVIMAILAGLTFAGLGRVRNRAKVDKTRSTIRKIHEVIMPQYEGYLRRRVPFTASTNVLVSATNRLRAIRKLILYEMPDSWGDVVDDPALTAVDAYLRTGPVRAYAAAKKAYKDAKPSFPSADYGSAECLFLIVSRGNSEPSVMEQFRPDEIGDVDGDNAPEFLDGWNRPIEFIRWAPAISSPLQASRRGVNSAIQVGDPVRFHDPLDPFRVDSRAFAMTPLIVSPGADGVLDLRTTPPSGWWSPPPNSPLDGRSLGIITGTAVNFNSGTFILNGINTLGTRLSGTASLPLFLDNISNHDVSVR